MNLLLLFKTNPKLYIILVTFYTVLSSKPQQTQYFKSTYLIITFLKMYIYIYIIICYMYCKQCEIFGNICITRVIQFVSNV